MTFARHLWNKSQTAALVFMAVQAAMASEPTGIYNSSLLGSLATDARYDKVSPEFVRCPQDFSHASITFDKQAGTSLGVNEEYVRKALGSYFVRNGDDWRHDYSQVDAGVTGYLDLPDRTRVRWLVRAGGLALLLYPDGGVIYLAREITTNWKTISRSPWATVQVERKLYRKDGSDRFFVHVCFTNVTSHAIAFDKAKRTSVFYPNQWVESPVTTRQLVNEIRPVQGALTRAQTDGLAESMKNSKHETRSSLVILRPRDTYEYFISFNSFTKSAFEHMKASYVIVVMDGNVPLTDGKSVVLQKRDQADFVRCEVPIPTPIVLSPVPELANVPFEN